MFKIKMCGVILEHDKYLKKDAKKTLNAIKKLKI